MLLAARRWRGAVLVAAGPGAAVHRRGSEQARHRPPDRRVPRAAQRAHGRGHLGGAGRDRAAARSLARPRGRPAMLGWLATTLLGAGIALVMVAVHGHYATDTLAGYCAAVATVLCTAFAIDRLAGRRARGRTATSLRSWSGGCPGDLRGSAARTVHGRREVPHVGPPDRPATARLVVRLRRHRHAAQPAGPRPGARPIVEKITEAADKQLPVQVPRDVEQWVKIDAGVKVGAGALFALGKLPRLSALLLVRQHRAHHAGRAPLLGARGPERALRPAVALPQERRPARRAADRRGRHPGQAVGRLAGAPGGRVGRRGHREERRQGAEGARRRRRRRPPSRPPTPASGEEAGQGRQEAGEEGRS